MLTSTIPIVLALILGIVSFSASCFVIIRTLMPIIPAHPLSRRLPRTAFGLPKRKLSPAKKATLYIAFCDVLALATFLWQAIAESLGTSVDPTTDAGSSTRLWLALTARQSCLLVVAALTLLYVRLGKTLTFGSNDFHVWAPTVTLVLVSTLWAAGFSATKRLDSFYYGAIVYTGIVAIVSTGCFGGFLASLLTIRRNLTAHIAAQEEEWPPLKSQSKMHKPREGASFTTDDVEALRDGSSWLTSIRSERTHSTSAFSFSSAEESVAAPSSLNPYSSSTPAKSTFWFGIPSTANLHQPERGNEGIPPVPELPAAYRRTSSPMGVETDPFRREAPSTPQRNQTMRSGSGASAHSHTNSWLTEPSGTPSTPTQFSFPTTMKSRPASPASRFTRRTQPDEEAQFEEIPLAQDGRVDYRDSQYGVRLETPLTATAFSPSPRHSSEIQVIDGVNRPDSKATMVKPETPRPVLGGYGAYEMGGIFEVPDGEGNKAATSNLDPWRLAGWFISIWLPFTLAMPYLAMNLVSNPSASFTSSSIPVILLTLSVTLSSPILAIHVLLSSPPVPILPSPFFPSAEGRASLFGSLHDNTVSSGGPKLPVDMAERNPSQVTVHGRRSGDIWIERGHASDDGGSKFSRAISLTTPIPKLACLDPPPPEDERTLTNPTPEPGAFKFPPHKRSASEPNSPGWVYAADPVIEAASRILAQQAADKAQATRARLSSKVSAFTYATSTSYANEESDVVEDFGVQQKAKVMVAHRHYSSLGIANTIAIPPASTRSVGGSNPTTPILQTGGFAAAQEQRLTRDSLKHARSRSDMDASVVRASGVSVGNRSSASSVHMRTRSASSALLTPRMNLADGHRNSNSHRAPLTPPPSFPLPPTPPSVKALPHHQSRSISRQSHHSRSHSHASTRSAGTFANPADVDSVHLGSAVMRTVRQPEDDTWPATGHSDGEGYTSTSSFKFTGFNALDEEEVEALLVGGGPQAMSSVKPAAAPSTPKKVSGSGLNKMVSIPDSMVSFSSPEVHSTPKRSLRNRWKQHMSLPSLNLGRRGQHLKEEITTALAELGIRVDEESRRRTMYGSGTPSRRQQRGETSRRTPSPPIVNVHTIVTTKADVEVPSAKAARKSPARSSLIADSLPPIAQRYSRSLTVDQVEAHLRTPSPTDMDFVVPHVEATPQAVAAPQRVAVVAPLQFHRPIQPQRRASPTPAYHTTNNQFMRQIEVYRDQHESKNAAPSTKRARSPTISTTSSSSIPSHLRAEPRAWPPTAVANTFARAAGLAATSLASAWSSSSSLLNNNKNNNNENPLNPDLENIASSSSAPMSQPSTHPGSNPGATVTSPPLRPLSLLQGRINSTSTTGPTGKAKSSTTATTPSKSSSYVVAARSKSAGKTSKSTTTSSGKGSTGSGILPLGPTPKSTKSNKSGGRRGRQDENQNQIVGSVLKNNTENGSTPESGLKPLKLARSATAKARGVLRHGEVLPDVVVRPPSVVYPFNQRDVMA